VQLAASVFEVRRRSAHLRDEPFEHLGNCFARPGICHRDRDAVGVRQRESPSKEVMVMGIKGSNGSYLARAQGDAEIDHPDQAVAEGSVGKGQAT
jgi:hypothetical protein